MNRPQKSGCVVQYTVRVGAGRVSEMASQSPLLRQRKVTWVVEIGDAPAYAYAPYEKHVNHSKCEYVYFSRRYYFPD